MHAFQRRDISFLIRPGTPGPRVHIFSSNKTPNAPNVLRRTLRCASVSEFCTKKNRLRWKPALRRPKVWTSPTRIFRNRERHSIWIIFSMSWIHWKRNPECEAEASKNCSGSIDSEILETGLLARHLVRMRRNNMFEPAFEIHRIWVHVFHKLHTVLHQSLCNTLRTTTDLESWIAHAINTQDGRREAAACSSTLAIAMRRGNGHSLNTSREYIVQYKTNNPQRSSRNACTSHYFSLNGVSLCVCVAAKAGY